MRARVRQESSESRQCCIGFRQLQLQSEIVGRLSFRCVHRDARLTIRAFLYEVAHRGAAKSPLGTNETMDGSRRAEPHAFVGIATDGGGVFI